MSGGGGGWGFETEKEEKCIANGAKRETPDEGNP